ncbi:MAG TPA: type II toxin-antitoxin system Phd/YefM family antitoxin [Rhizomicrobium sp.]|jgi:prevent-host-death family protein|nr:type II toxin-antitoxin system Phd/YefM family antitoxin [Rhizomicrobium sp.]
MKTITLRDANQQFSRLVREVEAGGEPVTVLRNGKPAVKITAAEPKIPERTAAQKAALARLLDPKNHFMSPPGWDYDIGKIRDEDMNRHSAVRGLPDRDEEPAKTKRSRVRG